MYVNQRTRYVLARAKYQILTSMVNIAKLYRHIRILLAMPTPHQLEAELTLQTEGRQAQLIAKSRRLNKLKERLALLEIDAPPALFIEIEDLEREIKNAESL